MKKRIFSLLLLSACVCGAWADDTGMGLELSAEKKITKGFSAEVEGEFRTQDGVSDRERWSLGAGLEYKWNKWLKSDVGYTFIHRHYTEAVKTKNVHKEYDSPRHRAYVSLSGNWKLPAHLELSLRERYQYTYETEQFVERYSIATGERASDKVVGDESEHLFRSRLMLKWSRKKSAWSPYAHVEMLNDLQDGLSLDQMRYTVGTDYKLNKQNSIGVAYRYKDKSDKDDAKGHLFSLKYSYKF